MQDHLHWTPVFGHCGLNVFCLNGAHSRSPVSTFQNNAGVIIGTLFTRASLPSRRVNAEWDTSDTRRVLQTSGRALVEDYWGRYIAFLNDTERGHKFVIHGPAGGTKCFFTEFRGVFLFFSSVEFCPPAKIIPLAINWQYVVATLSTSIMPDSWETGLEQISSVLGGECVKLSRNKPSRSFYWHPAKFAGNYGLLLDADRTDEVHQTVMACTHAWASEYSHILHMLSGGLDSSILLACLNRAPTEPKVTSLNLFYSAGINSDEREFARMAARHFRSGLLEWETDAHAALDGLWHLPKHATPANFVPEFLGRRMLSSFCKEQKVEAIARGDGGDELFCASCSPYVCADALGSLGLSRDTLEIAFNSARIQGDTVWHVLLRGLRDSRHSLSANAMLEPDKLSKLVPSEARASALKHSLLLHPWLRSDTSLPPGKIWQIMTLSVTPPLHGAFATLTDPDEISPLFSQPIIELCLRVPTFRHFEGIWNRVLQRRAFARELPAAITWRTEKAVVDQFNKHLLKSNRELIREALLDGTLVHSGMIDRPKLESALAGLPTKGFGFGPDVFRLLSTEIWVNQWSGSRQLRAARLSNIQGTIPPGIRVTSVLPQSFASS